MAKWKIVCTHPIKLSWGVNSAEGTRQWLVLDNDFDEHDNGRIVSIAGIPWEDIPNATRYPTRASDPNKFGKIYDPPYQIAIREDITMDDFEVDIINY